MERYERLQVLGRGSYGTAFLVRLAGGPAAGSLRVVKEVPLDGVDERRRAEALQEAEVLKSLVHANIVDYDGAQVVDRCLCIVMEYADGGDLEAAIARRRMASRRYHERQAMAIFAQVALALEHVHACRILHRDLKAANVFLTGAGVAKLGDFGIARVLQASECCAATRIGTPHHLPPEMCDNQPYDFKADVWGLGVLLYEMLALEVPFSAPSFAALAVKICTAEPRPVPAVYSGKVRALLGDLLAKRAEDRPSSAEVAALPHVRRGIAAAAVLLKPAVPAAKSDYGAAGSASVPTTGRGRVSAVPTPMSSARSRQQGIAPALTVGQDVKAADSPLVETPKRARLVLPTAGAFEVTPPPAPPFRSDDCSPVPPPSPLVGLGCKGAVSELCSLDLSEVGILLEASTTCGLELEVPEISPRTEAALMAEVGPTTPEAGTGGQLVNLAGGVIDMSVTTSLLLHELERELNLG